jgi:hypothetical protein
MKKSLIVSSMALMASLTIAVAGSSQGEPGGWIINGKVNGNGTKVIQYTASYNDSFFGSVTCTGVHQTGKNFGTWGQDSFTCTAQPAGTALSNVTGSQPLTLANLGGWSSDYAALIGQSYLATAFNGVVSADGTSYTAVANY